jgi:hypothetical protein
MFDIFYSGTKPNLFVHEHEAQDISHAQELSRTRYFWWVNYLTDYSGFDFLFEPVPWEAEYTHAWPSQHHEYSGTFLVPTNNTEIQYKFHKNIIPNKQNKNNYNQLQDNIQFDYTWAPHPFDPPYRYVFGNQWYPANRMPTVEYHVPGARETKYIFTPRAELLPNKHDPAWNTQFDCEFDYSWRPDPGDTPYIYVFGNQWWSAVKMPTVKYTVPGATEIKYMPYPRARLVENAANWIVPDGVEGVDYSWVPDPGDPPYRYQFGTQHQATGGPQYCVPGATEVKYVGVLRSTINSVNMEYWSTPDNVTDFDYTWHPDDRDPPYIYQFGTQHQATGGPRYVVPGATEVKYITAPRSVIDSIDMSMWETPDDVTDFDYTWHPDLRDPPYIYQFGTQHQATGGPRYVVPGATEVKYVAAPRARRTNIDDCWTIPENTNLQAFDLTWHPDSRESAYIYQFVTQWNRAGGPTYTAPGATEIKYVTAQIARMLPTDRNWAIPAGIDINSFDFSWTPDITEQPYIYEFGTQWQKTGGPRYIVPGATEVKYITEPRAHKTTADDCWTVPDGADIDSFDWTWHPDSTEQPYIYQFGTQHQRTGGPQYRLPGATDVKYIDQIRITTDRVATAIYEIDHMCGNAGQIPDTVKTVRYFDNYLDTLKRIAKGIPDEHEFIWICSSVCDYSNFDFSWHPEVWQAGMLHVFPSDDTKFGDTFFMHVPTFQYRADKLQLLDWYDINYMDISVPRRPLPVVEHNYDTHVEAVKTMDFKGPLAVYTTGGAQVIPPPAVPLWREKTKTIIPLSSGASTVIVPKVAVPYIKTQLYDYANIDRSQRHLLDDEPLDIVFIDNGEPNADYNYQHLCAVASLTWANRIQRSTGVDGRVAAYQAAAELSTTPWFFAVFAKLHVDTNFNWRWQPDRLQEPKHYIFHALNPVNGLVYGHQAMIAYNKELVLNNPGVGLDFTLDSAHEVVPILSGTAEYATSKWSAWRTAFREVIKLKASNDVESRYRLGQWLKDSTSAYGMYSMWGAEDAVEYYNAVAGDFAELKKSYDWSWLATYAMIKRNLTPD